MKWPLVSFLTFIIFAGIFAYLLFLFAPAYLYALWPKTSHYISQSGLIGTLTQNLETVIPQSTPIGLSSQINRFRQAQALPPFILESNICPEASSSTILCPTCAHATQVSITKYATTHQLLARLLQDETTATALNNPQLTHLCIALSGDNLNLLFATVSKSVAQPSKMMSNPLTISTPVSTFNSDELWSALSTYRQTHQRSQLELSQSLCQYAQKRVQDHLTLIESQTPATKYPNPDKYPLDSHQGFSLDAQSGYAFEVTQTQRLAENLAYFPSAETATQIIEWGWDTSTEGHREAQLSNDFNRGCIWGQDGFYVAIFGS